MKTRWAAAGVLAAAAFAAAACGTSAGTGASPASSAPGNGPATATAPAQAAQSPGGTALGTAKAGGATVLTDARGYTLYWFAPDTASASRCSGSCATYWPPVKGPATAGKGVTGTLATITRADGTSQATWNGHPLYTYAGDHAPGQAAGNGLNINGGLWHEVTISGAAAPAPAQSSGGGYNSGGGGGYGGGY